MLETNFVCRLCGTRGYHTSNSCGLFRCTCDGCGVMFDRPDKFSLPPVKFVALHEDTVIPKRHHDGDVGYDAVSIEDIDLPPLQVVMVKTGVSVELPPHTEMQVRSRSGMAKKYGIMVANGPGTIDTGYRGPCNILLINTTTETYKVSKGDKIAQFLVTPKLPYTFKVVTSLNETVRGDGAFESTGK